MKRRINISLICALFSAALFSACFDNSSSADSANKFDAAVVCPADGMNAYGEPNRGTFTDARDGQVYKYTTIGNQVWMAENLKFDAPYSLCYGKIDGFCNTFGKFYSLFENGEDLGLFDQELLDTICPAGWHVPSADEWTLLSITMGDGAEAMPRLKSSDDFGSLYKPGTDDCGFNALPAGSWLKDGSTSGTYVRCSYWTSTAINMKTAYSVGLSPKGISYGINDPKLPIRCVRN